MIPLIATKTYTFGGLKLRPGVEFSASPKEAKVLKAVGRAKDKPATPAKLPEIPVLVAPKPDPKPLAPAKPAAQAKPATPAKAK